MDKDETLSRIFNQVTDKHSIIKNTVEKSFMTKYNFMEVHCIDIIGKTKDPNVTKLSKAFKVTRGAISKITKKLINDGAIETYQSPENKKEIYYKLTDIGSQIYHDHEKMHRERLERDILIFSRLSDGEKDSLISTLTRMNEQLDCELVKLNSEKHVKGE